MTSVLIVSDLFIFENSALCIKHATGPELDIYNTNALIQTQVVLNCFSTEAVVGICEDSKTSMGHNQTYCLRLNLFLGKVWLGCAT